MHNIDINLHDIIIDILDLNSLIVYSNTCQYINFLTRTRIQKLRDIEICQTCFKNWYKKSNESSMLKNIVRKLTDSGNIDVDIYADLDVSSLKKFDESIGWGVNFWHNSAWKECFSPRLTDGEYIEWNDNEQFFLEETWDIYVGHNLYY